MKCDGCGSGENQVVQYGNYILDSQTIAKMLGKHHETAKANHKQKWLRTTGIRFDMQLR
jgi:hypothetical protein